MGGGGIAIEHEGVGTQEWARGGIRPIGVKLRKEAAGTYFSMGIWANIIENDDIEQT